MQIAIAILNDDVHCVKFKDRTDCDNVTVLFYLLDLVCVVTYNLAFEHYN